MESSLQKFSTGRVGRVGRTGRTGRGQPGVGLLSLAVVAMGIFGGCSSNALGDSSTLEQPSSSDRIDRGRSGSVAVSATPFEEIDEGAYHYYVNGLIFLEIDDIQSAARSFKRARGFWKESYEINVAYVEMLIRLQRPREAIAILSEMTTEDAQIYYWRAAAYRMLGDNEGAMKANLELVRIDSTRSAAYSYLAGYYRRLNHIDSTIWAYQNMVRLRPTNYRILNDLARLLTMRGELDSARDLYYQSLSINRSGANVLVTVGLAEIFEQLQQSDSATAILRLGLQLEPDNAIVNRQLSVLYARMDSAEVAVGFARRLVQLQPDNTTAVRRLGLILLSADSLTLADSVFTALVASGDDATANHYYLGRIAAMLDDMERARSEFEIVSQRADTLASSWIDLAITLRRLNKYEEEINTYLTGLNHVRSESGRINILFSLGAAYEQGGEYEKSVETFEEVLANAPDNAQALNYLGYMLADKGERLEYAERLIRRAIELVPTSGAYLDSFGWVHYRLGNLDLAVEYLERAVKLGSDAVIFDHLGDAYEARGSREEARRWWEKALELQKDNDVIRNKLNR